MDDQVNNNARRSRYELHAEGGIAIAEYQLTDDIVTFTHTIVPEALRGRGLASRLVGRALADVRQRGLKIRAQCPFVADYVDRHPEMQDL
ncbi:MAG TPA: GNAT family N-acetyltransferase, partial [Sphingomonas sp.]|nr:GNAT family N-acetyltransferase [Sphingomonas sp.]